LDGIRNMRARIPTTKKERGDVLKPDLKPREESPDAKISQVMFAHFTRGHK